MKFGVADYGMNAWYGGLYDVEQRLSDLKGIGYNGLERVNAVDAADAVEMAARYHRLGMDFATVRGPSADTTIRWTAGLGKEYVWTQANGRRGNDFDTFCRQVNAQIEICKAWGVETALHNHLGTVVENQGELLAFLKACPEAKLILDTAHLAAADGDPLAIAKEYPDRVIALHLKDWITTNPEIGLDQWFKRGRFCELDAGNIGLDNVAVLKALVDNGFNGWVFVEQDTHLQDPLIDLKHSRDLLKKAGF